jgi:hypothetical protein
LEEPISPEGILQQGVQILERELNVLECKNQIWPENMPDTPLKEQMNNGTTRDGVTEGKFYLRALRWD